MSRTPAQVEAAERDGPYCLWHLHSGQALVPNQHVHHIGRRKLDIPQACIGLCAFCHEQHHRGFEPYTGQLIDLMRRLYGYDLRALHPEVFGAY